MSKFFFYVSTVAALFAIAVFSGCGAIDDGNTSGPVGGEQQAAPNANTSATVESAEGQEFVNLEKSEDFDVLIASSDVPVLFDFYADWCGPCKIQGKILHDMKIPLSKAKVVKIDVDKHQDLAERFDVTGIPTLLVFRDGAQTFRQVGLAKAAEINKQLE